MAADILILVAAAVFATLRIYALLHGSKSLSTVTLSLGLMAPIISSYVFVNTHPISSEITPGKVICYTETSYAANL
ncbi:hypothetical protein EVJ58_g6489 [Rhodofomes roseus]|uniref:Uncharacterized protein n=1 Tax=Rhodofomes roseus TaxID=34475 RepID=A0A4Y9Y820_9APHY|nr:hypothetical protein EVJ58_g6489 [Rhodofomes roseus]